MLLASIVVKAQAPQNANYFLYSYDATGNRTMRQYIIYQSPSKVKDSIAQHTDSTATVAAQQQLPQETLPNGEQITVFPNPTEGVLQISITNFKEGSKGYIMITDLQGRVVAKRENINSTNSFDISSAAKGNYVLKIVVNNTSRSLLLLRSNCILVLIRFANATCPAPMVGKLIRTSIHCYLQR